jgi:peptidoglycan/LPS O-acetylase OafA/YrhL
MIQSPSHLPSNTYRPDIDGLRALAIIFVVIYHAFPTVATGGFTGVDVFFVISGFLISTIIYTQLDAGHFSFIEFYIRRIKRIFPALFLVLTFCFVFGWFNLLADEFQQLGKHIAGGAGFISNLMLWKESGYFDNASETKPLLHLWSLGVEEQFYFIWPIFLWFAWKKKINFLVLGCVVGLISFFANIYEVHYGQNITSAFYLPVNRFWELMAGAILAYLKLNKKNVFKSLGRYRFFNYAHNTLEKVTNEVLVENVVSTSGVALLVLGALLITKDSSFPGYWGLLPVLGAVFLVGAGQRAWFNRFVLSSRPLVWIGLISFPLYLWHWPLLSFAHLMQGSMPSVEMRLITIVASVLLSAATYYLIERPIRSNKFNRTKALILVLLLTIIGYIGFNTYQRDGLTFRLNQIRFRLPPLLQDLSLKDPADSALNLSASKLDCSSGSNGDQENPSSNCLSATDLKKPAIFIWGDSYAAHLTIGYEERFEGSYRFARVALNGCPPIMDVELSNRKNCITVNRQVFERVLQERPARLVIAANWTDYDWSKIEGTLAHLKKAGYDNIDLVGPAPVWNDGLLKFLEDRDPNIPYRMKFGLNKDFLMIDSALESMAKRLGVHYISISKILCNQDGCITRFGETSDTLESIDAGHFTKYTSRYVVSHFPGM